MTEKRFKVHIFDDGVNERYYDGIIDMEKDEVIVNYQFISNLLNVFNDENEQLKEKLNEIKNGLISDLEKGIEEQPIVLSMYLQKHIAHLENKIHRMRDRIKQLEALYHYRGQNGSADLKRDLWEFKQKDNFSFNYTQDTLNLNKDKIHLVDTRVAIDLKKGNLCIKVFLPNDCYKFDYKVVGRTIWKKRSY